MERFFTDVELAEMWQVDVQAIWRLARSGALVGFKVGRAWRFSGAAVQDFTKAQRPAEVPRPTGLHPKTAEALRRQRAS